MLPLTLCKLAALHSAALPRMGLLLAPVKPIKECFLLLCATREGQSTTPKPYGGSRRTPKWAESTRVWVEGDHRTELRFSFPKALTQRRMGRTNLRGTWTKRHKGIAFPSPWKSKIPAKGWETMVEQTSWQKRRTLDVEGKWEFSPD